MKKRFSILLMISFVLLTTTKGQDIYDNAQIGIKILKPTNWIAATNNDLKNNLGKMKFNEEELQRIINSNKGILTIASYYKYKIESVSGLIPTIKVTVRSNPTTNMSEFKQMMMTSADRAKTMVKDFVYLDDFKEINISGFTGLVYSCRYSLTLADGSKMTMRNRYYMIPKGSSFITVSLMDNESNENSSQTFDNFINDLELAK